MHGSQCRLFDENVVRQIMLTTGMSIAEYMKVNIDFDAESICDFIEENASVIIDRTIESINPLIDFPGKGISEPPPYNDDIDDVPFDVPPPKW